MKNIALPIKRRNFIATISGFVACGAFSNTLLTVNTRTMKEQQSDLFDMKLRPHHIIDIITDFGNNIEYQPHPYGHSLHLAGPKLLANLDLKVKLVLEADDV